MISYILWFYFLSSFFDFSRAVGVRNTTVGDQDSSVTFTPDWQSVSASGETYKSTNEPGAALDVSLPNGTLSVSYVGFKQSGGALYGICLDCDDNGEGSFAIVDGHDLTSNGQESLTTLFTITGIDPTVQHTLTVVNLPDPRFSNTGQLTFDSLDVSSSNIEPSSILSTSSSTESPSSTVSDSPTNAITFASLSSEQFDTTTFASVLSTASGQLGASFTPTSTVTSSKSLTSSVSGTVSSSSDGLSSASSTQSSDLVSSATSTALVSSSGSALSTTSSQSRNLATPSQPTLLPSGTSNGVNMPAQRTALSNSSIALITTLFFLALFFLILIVLVLIRRRRRRLRYLARRQRTPGVLSSWTPPANTVDLPPEEGRMSEMRPESGTPTRPSRYAQGIPSFIWEPTQPLQPRPRVEDPGGPGYTQSVC